MTRLARTISLLGAALLLLPGAAAAEPGNGAGGVTGPAFYVDGALYRTVGTPTDLSRTGAPAHSFDTIYAIAGQPNVATAGPGDRDFNGGRWMVLELSITDYATTVAAVDANASGDIDSAAEVGAAIDGGYATIGDLLRTFECPVIKVPRSRS